MSVTGFPDGPPVKAGPTLVDFMGGIHLYAGDRDRALRPRPQRAGPARRGGDAGDGVFVARRQLWSTTTAPASSRRAPATASRGWPARHTMSFPTADGWVAIHVVTEAHWKNLLKAMGREELGDDPRFATNAARVAHHGRDRRGRGGVDAHAAARWRCSPRRKGYRIPCAPVRTAPEVMNDPHMHGRGMLERIDHPELGDIVVPTSPLRLHGADKVAGRRRARRSGSTTPRSMAAGSACPGRNWRRSRRRARSSGSGPGCATAGERLHSAVPPENRGVAQPGRAPALGAGCRRFESSRPDQRGGRASARSERRARWRWRAFTGRPKPRCNRGARDPQMGAGLRAGEPPRPRPADGLVERAGHAEPGAAAFRHARGGGRLREEERPRLHA